MEELRLWRVGIETKKKNNLESNAASLAQPPVYYKTLSLLD